MWTGAGLWEPVQGTLHSPPPLNGQFFSHTHTHTHIKPFRPVYSIFGHHRNHIYQAAHLSASRALKQLIAHHLGKHVVLIPCFWNVKTQEDQSKEDPPWCMFQWKSLGKLRAREIWFLWIQVSKNWSDFIHTGLLHFRSRKYNLHIQ